MKIGHQKKSINCLIWSLAMLVLSCQPQAALVDVHGDVQVLIPVNQTESKPSEQITSVTLKEIQSLGQVSGSYVHFYYSPGAKEGALQGSAPQAQFIRNKNGVYVAKDYLTQQMFTLYYHVQNLADFNTQISPDLKPTAPFSIGLNTKLQETNEASQNNAFYDGESNALLFVPYSLKNTPIAINSGIIAHEFFHSVFYKLVLKSFHAKQQSIFQSVDELTDSETQEKIKNNLYYNQTYIRGINEGVADFWGWIYTNNVDYISLSLPEFGGSRKMTLDKDLVGLFIEQQDIENKVKEALRVSSNPSEYLSGYIYKIGTPHARFLKELTTRISIENKIALKEAQLMMAKALYKMMIFVEKNNLLSNQDTKLEADGFFKYFAQPEISDLPLSAAQCDFVMKYLRSEKTLKTITGKTCKGANE
jgi:hypothetical protein